MDETSVKQSSGRQNEVSAAAECEDVTISIRKIHPLFGAEIAGVDLTRPLSPQGVAAIQKAIDQYGVLVFRDQHISDDQFALFASMFGTVQDISAFKKSGFTTDSKFVGALSNIDERGNLLPDDHVKRGILEANEFWHTDGTYFQVRARYSFLKPKVLPPVGGETEYCDTRVAFDALDSQTQQRIENLVGEHCLLYSRTLTGFDINSWDEDQRALFPSPVPRPLVEVHPGSGRKAICLASHIKSIHGLPDKEARELAWDLIAVATVPERVYQHRWRIGDLVMWDNRCTMHRGRPYEKFVHKRDMRSARVLDSNDAGAEPVQMQR